MSIRNGLLAVQVRGVQITSLYLTPLKDATRIVSQSQQTLEPPKLLMTEFTVLLKQERKEEIHLLVLYNLKLNIRSQGPCFM